MLFGWSFALTLDKMDDGLNKRVGWASNPAARERGMTRIHLILYQILVCLARGIYSQASVHMALNKLHNSLLTSPHKYGNIAFGEGSKEFEETLREK
jgi:hypothetical protein